MLASQHIHKKTTKNRKQCENHKATKSKNNTRKTESPKYSFIHTRKVFFEKKKKKKQQKKNKQKQNKKKQMSPNPAIVVIFVCNTLSLPTINFHQYCEGSSSYRADTKSIQTQEREITPKVRKPELSFLYTTLNLILFYIFTK